VVREAALAAIDRDAAATPAVEDMFAGLLALERSAGAEHHLNLLTWLVGLPGSLDPAAAARAVLDYQQANPAAALSAGLNDLLATVSGWSCARLDELSRNRRSFRTEARSV
jgi:hypothetical protein